MFEDKIALEVAELGLPHDKVVGDSEFLHVAHLQYRLDGAGLLLVLQTGLHVLEGRPEAKGSRVDFVPAVLVLPARHAVASYLLGPIAPLDSGSVVEHVAVVLNVRLQHGGLVGSDHLELVLVLRADLGEDGHLDVTVAVGRVPVDRRVGLETGGGLLHVGVEGGRVGLLHGNGNGLPGLVVQSVLHVEVGVLAVDQALQLAAVDVVVDAVGEFSFRRLERIIGRRDQD